MRISDWSSDVCSSDLIIPIGISQSPFTRGRRHRSPHRRQLHTGLLARRVTNAVRGNRSLALALIVAARVQGVHVCGEIGRCDPGFGERRPLALRSEEYTSDLPSPIGDSYAVLRINNKK